MCWTHVRYQEGLLDAKSVNNNIILTRGVCREVQECLRFTARNGNNHFGSKFSQVSPIMLLLTIICHPDS